jgi:hypothetical protein
VDQWNPQRYASARGEELEGVDWKQKGEGQNPPRIVVEEEEEEEEKEENEEEEEKKKKKKCKTTRKSWVDQHL